MASAQDDHDDLGIDQGMSADSDIIDVDGIDEPLSATPLRGGDYDDEGDDDLGESSAAEFPPISKKSSGGMKKIIAPLLVLLLAGGAGSYIVMNPALLSGLQSGGINQVAPPVLPAPVMDVSSSVSESSAVPQEMADVSVPPQPLANLNEVPEGIAPEGVVDVPLSIAPEVVPEISPEAVLEADSESSPEVTSEVASEVAEQDSAVEPAVDPLADVPGDVSGDVVERDDRVAVLGSDVTVSPEAVNVTPEAVPEIVPEDASTVTEPTFVPAPPDASAVVVDAPVVENPAVPPVMNVQEVTGAQAPELTPRTISQTPEAVGPGVVGGVADSPVAPLPASEAASIYYDSLSQVPSGAMATSVGPRELNPVLEPASKMIVVNKDKGEGSQESLLVSANRALKLKRYDAALEMFDQLYAKNKRDTRILMGRAVAQQNMGLNESAIQTYEEVLVLKPGHTEALVNMLGLVRTQYPEVALRRLLELYSKHPNNAGIAAQIGVTNAALGHLEDALRYLGIAATLEPQNAQHLFNMAIAADRHGSSSEAVRLYERTLEVDAMYGSGGSVPRDKIYDRLSVLRRG